jgi:hypothetical protein
VNAGKKREDIMGIAIVKGDGGEKGEEFAVY